MIVDLIEALAWPVAVLVLVGLVVWRFGSNFSDLIDSVSRIRFRDMELGIGPQRVAGEEPAEDVDEVSERELDAFQEGYENALEMEHEDREELLSELARAQVDLIFERVLREIYGSQLQALRYLLGQIPDGIDRETLLRFYNEVKARVPTHPYKSPEPWIAFLQGTEMIEVGIDGRFRLTDRGQAFVIYVNANRLRPPLDFL